MSKKGKQHRTSWSEAAELHLLDLWQHKISDLRSARKNAHVHAEISSELSKAGFTFSGAEVRVKIHNLTTRYKAEKTQVGPSGGAPSKWKHNQAVHQILGGFKSFNATGLVEDSIMEDIEYLEEAMVSGQSTDHEMESSSEASRSISMPPELAVVRPGSSTQRTPTKKNIGAEMLVVMERMNNNFEKLEEKAEVWEERKVVLLEKYVSDFSEMKDSVVNFLNRQP